MSDVMKKRVIGVLVLLIIGVLGPLLLSRYIHSGADEKGASAMRVYDIKPNGDAEPAGGSSSGQDSADNGLQASSGNTRSESPNPKSAPPHPDAISPQSVPRSRQRQAAAGGSGESFSTPPVHGDNGPTGGGRSRGQSRSDNGVNGQANASASSNPGSAPSSAAGGSSGASGGSNVARNDHPSGWVVQVASFSNPDYARGLANKLGGQFKASYSAGTVNGKTWYRVYVGPFNAEGAARSAASRLRQQGRKPLVRHLP